MPLLYNTSGTAALAVEISDATLALDLTDQAELYATAGNAAPNNPIAVADLLP